MSGQDVEEFGEERTLSAAIEDLRVALKTEGSAAVLVAPPGTGKTTIVPIALLSEPWAQAGRILLLEPRRLATRAAARRMADLLGEQVGATVGFRTRDERRVGRDTRIEVVTEGILTRRLQHDPELPGVSLVIFDELHERNLTTDLGLALCLDVRRTIRPDLRIMAMSATLDSGRIANLLAGGQAADDPRPDRAGVSAIFAGGRPHPVEVRWFPRKPAERLEPAVVSTILTALRREEGDILVFLPGAGEINRVAGLLENAKLPEQGVDIRPLYGMLGAADQDAALLPSPAGRRRVVIATDIAESSLTVEGVRIVIDSGLARAPRFDSRTGLTRLRTVSVSKASTEQRAGRAGRQGPGTVYRLWTKGEQASRRAHHEPEILQVDLAGLALELAMWGTPAAEMPFLDQPPDRTMTEAIELLATLGAIDDDGRLSDLGRRMNGLPLHPRLARMVTIAADVGPHEGALACGLAVLLDERDVLRGRPDELPTDVGLRLALLADPSMRHPSADGRALGASRHRLRDLLSRASVTADLADVPASWRSERAGPILALAYPDRLAVRRAQVGRFQLRSGAAAWVPKGDVLASEPFLVTPDLDGDRKEARIRLAAPIAAEDVGRLFGEEVDTRTSVVWDRQRDELVERIERRLGNVVLDETTRRPDPSDAVVGLLLDRVRDRGLGSALTWSATGRAIVTRVAFCHRVLGDPWPDWSDERLIVTLEAWLAPFLMFATGRSDLEKLDPATTLLAGLDPRIAHDLDRVAPTHLTTPSGRRAAIDYDDPSGQPVLAVRVQDMFGASATPTIAGGRVPLLLHLLSPAGRPVQITSDLAGFWTGSYRDVRKEMAGRYPKHRWPENPATG